MPLASALLLQGPLDLGLPVVPRLGRVSLQVSGLVRQDLASPLPPRDSELLNLLLASELERRPSERHQQRVLEPRRDLGQHPVQQQQRLGQVLGQLLQLDSALQALRDLALRASGRLLRQARHSVRLALALLPFLHFNPLQLVLGSEPPGLLLALGLRRHKGRRGASEGRASAQLLA